MILLLLRVHFIFVFFAKIMLPSREKGGNVAAATFKKASSPRACMVQNDLLVIWPSAQSQPPRTLVGMKQPVKNDTPCLQVSTHLGRVNNFTALKWGCLIIQTVYISIPEGTATSGNLQTKPHLPLAFKVSVFSWGLLPGKCPFTLYPWLSQV